MTGAQRWAAQYSNPQSTSGADTAAGVAVSPDATKIYVTGTSNVSTGTSFNEDYATVAYTADTGNQLWASTYDGPTHAVDRAVGLAATGDGAKVVVTGTSNGGATNGDYATIAYDTTTGAQSWVNRQNFVTLPSNDVAHAMTLVPATRTVVVTGARQPVSSSPDIEWGTIAITP